MMRTAWPPGKGSGIDSAVAMVAVGTNASILASSASATPQGAIGRSGAAALRSPGTSGDRKGSRVNLTLRGCLADLLDEQGVSGASASTTRCMTENGGLFR